ncbi:MAG TPA: pitrilysin family protein [Candidatus Paceibacterota bacterium]
MSKKAKHPTHKAFAFVREIGGVWEYLMKSNGLRVLISPDHSSATVTLNVVYLVGSRNEAVGHTGATHLLEHLMFKGSKKFNKKTGRTIDTLVFGMGGIANATTWFDRTNYFELIPKSRLFELMELEADRMRNALINEVDRASEMIVVRNEFEGYENNPSDPLEKEVWATAFREHPYHHPTIGWKSDVENMSIERLQAFYNEFYHPNNACLTLVGDVEIKEGLDLVEKYFGHIKPSKNKIPVIYTTEPKQEGERRVAVRRNGELPILMMGYKVPSATHKDLYALEVLAFVLGSGRTSRLYRRLVDGGFASALSVSNQAFRDAGLFMLTVTLNAGIALDNVESLVNAELVRLATEQISDEELARVIYQTKVHQASMRDGSYALTRVLTECIASGDWTIAMLYAKNIEKVSKDDVTRVVKEYMKSDALTVGNFIPKK